MVEELSNSGNSYYKPKKGKPSQTREGREDEEEDKIRERRRNEEKEMEVTMCQSR